MKLLLIVSAIICFTGCTSSENKPANPEQPSITEKTEPSPESEGDFTITLLDGGSELMKLTGKGTLASNDGKVLRIYLDDKEKETSVTIETGNIASGEYKIGGSINGKDYASVLIIPGEKLNLQFPLSLETGAVKISTDGNSGSGSIDGSSVLRGKTYYLKGTFKMKIDKIKMDY